MSIEAFGGDGSGVEEGRHDADGRIVLAGEMERRPLAPPAGRRGGIPGLLAGVGLFGEQVDCLAPPGLVAELRIHCSSSIFIVSIEHCTGTRRHARYVPLRRDERKDTNRHMMCWVRETFCTGERHGPRLICTHQTYHQPTASGGREPTTTGTTCSPCGCREAWWKSKRKSKAQQEKKKITGADNCTSYAFQTD